VAASLLYCQINACFGPFSWFKPRTGLDFSCPSPYNLLMSKQPVKPQGAAGPDRPPLRLPELNARIRARRSQLGLTGAELAQRSGISPSYVSLIESGAKVPDEDVAADLARALDDDEGLYVALAQASRLGPGTLELLNRLDAASRKPAYMSLVESGHAVPRLAKTEEEDLAARMREVASRLTSPSPAEPARTQSSVLSIPVLAEAADPSVLDRDEPGRAVVDTLLLDARLVAGSARGLFACDVTPRTMKHLRGVAQPGDRIVFQRDAALAPDRICAVRSADSLVLSRVLYNGRTLLLLPGEGETGFESIELKPGTSVADVLAGSHVLLIRR
jgi:transcriptional regulator with XRE-family HTH domain